MCLYDLCGRNVLCVPKAANSERQPAQEKQILQKNLLMESVVLVDPETNIDLQLLF